MWEPAFLRQIRELEADWAMSYFPPAGRVLEIGAGAGWQALCFARGGYEVAAVDVDDERYGWDRVFPIAAYDGLHLPFPDASFDVVYSSSVLEHVERLGELLVEIARVLKPGGKAVQVTPSAVWRAWSNVTQIREVWPRVQGEWNRTDLAGPRRVRAVLAAVWHNAIPRRHGEVGNAWTEIYWFSSFRWRRCFQQAGFRVSRGVPNRIFYTGPSLLGSRLSVDARRRLSDLLGSPSLLYVLEKR